MPSKKSTNIQKSNMIQLSKFSLGLFLTLAVLLGMLVMALFYKKEGLPRSKKTMVDVVTETSSSKEGWQTAGVPHFSFEHPAGWHVFNDGDRFEMDKNPIVFFPHEPRHAVSGSVIEKNKKTDVLASLQKTLKKVGGVTNPSAECYESTIKEEDDPDYGIPGANGRMTCLVEIPWQRDYSFFYQFEMEHTNDPQVRAMVLQFINSIKSTQAG